MFGLYPAGAQWTRHFASDTRALDAQKLLVDHAGFAAGILHQPFGVDRGAVVAQYGNYLLLVAPASFGKGEFVVVPDVQMQNLLWSFETGYANQWSDRELRALTGCDSWDALLKRAAADFAVACEAVASAMKGTLGKPKQARAGDALMNALMDDDDNVGWLPSDYLFDSPMPEVPSCAR